MRRRIGGGFHSPRGYVQNRGVSEPDHQAMARFSAVVLQAVKRASGRSAALVHQDLKKGLSELATITSIAPLVGILGTLWGILNAFSAPSGEQSAALGHLAGRLSNACVPTALGLLVGLQSLYCHRYLIGRLETVDLEMENASLELVNRLTPYAGQLKPAIEQANSVFDERAWPELRQDPRPPLPSIFPPCAALLIAWFVEVASLFEYDMLPITSATTTAFAHVLLTFGISFFPAYAVWTKLLHRRSGGLVVLASAFCLCWSLVQFVLQTHLL